MRLSSRLASTVAAVAALAALAPGTVEPAPMAATTESAPLVTGPLAGGQGRPFFPSLVRPAAYGYTETEYLLSGVAKAYGVTRAAAAYTTRMLVYRPSDPKKFNGTAFVEWNNVTFQADVPVDFTWSYPHIFATGAAYVQVTAQQVGVCGPGLSGVLALLCNPLSLKGADPQRYARLLHPGDDYSYDIFTQAARALTTEDSPLGRLRARRLIAVGESQSAGALDLYMRYGADREAKVFDGFLIDGDAHSTIPRTYRVPTLHLWSEESAQPVPRTWAPNHRIWMVAGAAHIDRWALDQALPQILRSATTGGTSTSKAVNLALRRTSGDYGQYGAPASSLCAGGTEFPRRYVIDAALSALEQWVKDGVPAPRARGFRFTPLGAGADAPTVPYLPGLPAEDLDLVALLTSPFALVRDRDGNAVGGLRLPVVRVPVARYDGTGCLLLGTSTRFTETKLRGLYPSHAIYVAAMASATRGAVDRRIMTRRDGLDLLRRACRSAIPERGVTAPADRPGTCSRLRRVL